MPDAGASRYVFPVLAVEAAAKTPTAPEVVVESHEIASPFDGRLILWAEPTSAQADAYRLLRHRLLTHGNPRVISVTSAMPSEGKTTCAANLALAIAEESSASVLLLDANRLRPALAEMFGVALGPGVLELAPRHSYSTHALGETLFLAEIMNGESSGARIDRLLLKSALDDLGAKYDYVVLDGSSVSESVDAVVLSELADGVIFALQRGFSAKRRLRRALRSLAPERVLGAVLLDA